MTKIIKLTWPSDWPLLRQTPGQKGIWDDYQFVINDQLAECDYWVVYEDLLQKESVKCPSGNVMLVTAEPPPVKTYHPKFLKQFDVVVTCQENLLHKGRILNQQALPWHVGRRQKDHVDLAFSKDYDELTAVASTGKSKLISVISSNKEITPEHKKRVAFFKLLRQEFGEAIDFFGRGFNEIEDKWDAIAPYKYHIVLENSSFDHYWTEKLADTYLGGAFPIYYGAPNLAEYFPVNSYALIDIDDSAGAIEKIKTIIGSGMYEKHTGELEVAKDMVLNRYNLFPLLAELIQKKDLSGPKTKKTIYPLSHFTREIFTMHNFRMQCKNILQFSGIMGRNK